MPTLIGQLNSPALIKTWCCALEKEELRRIREQLFTTGSQLGRDFGSRSPMCRGLASFPSSCLEKAKGMRVKFGHLAERHERTHKYRSSEEKVLPDLETLLSRKVGLQAFQWFLRSEFSEENLEFWLACEDYRRSEDGQLGTKAQGIYSRFINSEAPQEVNLDSETREALARVTEDPRADAFNEAQQSIYSLMAKDSFPRFLRSSYCQEMLKAL